MGCSGCNAFFRFEERAELDDDWDPRDRVADLRLPLPLAVTDPACPLGRVGVPLVMTEVDGRPVDLSVDRSLLSSSSSEEEEPELRVSDCDPKVNATVGGLGFLFNLFLGSL